MSAYEKPAIGQEVRVFAVYGDVSPPGGWEARVTRVSDIGYEVHVADWLSRVTFGADNRSTDPGGKYLAMTPEWADKHARRSAALAVLAENCIMIEPGSCLSVDQIEALADLARTFTDPAEGE